MILTRHDQTIAFGCKLVRLNVATTKLIIASLLSCVSPVASSFGVEYDQEYHEYLFAQKMADVLTVAQLDSNTSLWVTNIMQITSMMPTQYLATTETTFLAFGERAGFTNSLLEKYILLPQGAVQSSKSGYIMLVGANPLKRRDRKLH